MTSLIAEKADKVSLNCVENASEKPSEIPFVPSASPEPVHVKSKLERKLVLKQDLTMLPLLAGCFFFSYVDRGQIGNARVLGMQKDLHLTSDQYYNVLLVFFIGYMLIELPCCLGLIYVKPGHQFGIATVLFGVLASCISACNSEGALIAVRFLLGLCEAFVQVGFVYLSLWYRREEIALRCAIFYISGPLAGAVSGLIAYGVAKDLEGADGIRAWRWLFIVEGIPTIAWGILTFFALPARPQVVAEKGTRLFSTQTERDMILERTVAARNSVSAKFVPRQILHALSDVKTWLDAFIVAAFGLAVAAFGLFLPTFVKEFGFSALRTQLFIVIPYACAVVSLPVICAFADRWRMRAIPMLFCFCLCAAGLILLLATTNQATRIVGTCLVASGSYPGVILAATWVMATHGGYTKRSTAWAVCQAFLQCFSILGTKIYNTPPRFLKGHGVVLGLLGLAAVCIGLKWVLMWCSNNRKDTASTVNFHTSAQAASVGDGIEELGENHPQFRYLL